MALASSEDGEKASSQVSAVEIPVNVKAIELVSSCVYQTDDLNGNGEVKGEKEHQPTHQQKLEGVKQPQTSILTPRSSRGTWPDSSWEPRPSVVSVVAIEVATFFDVFGWLGIPMILIFVLSATWTFMLAVIQVHTNEAANAFMNTTEFDNGKFWLLPQPESALIYSSVVLLSLFGVGYTGLALMMLFNYRAAISDKSDEAVRTSNPVSNSIERPQTPSTSKQSTGFFFQRVLIWVRDIPIDIRQRYYTITLYTYLGRGFPTPIIYYYSVLLLCNWLVASYRNYRYVTDPALIIARLYYTFDLFFAVFAPLVVLIYFVHSFKFDRAAFLTKTETLPPGSFDRVARLFGDPSEISSFCSAFHYLQFSSGTTLFSKSALNLLSLYKWQKIIRTLIHNRLARQVDRKRKALIGPIAKKIPREESLRATIGKALTLSKSKVGKHFVPRLFLSLVFLLAGIGNFVYSIGAVESTADLCSKYEKCVVASYHWNFGQKDCTCLVFADRQIAPQSYAEWTNPDDVTANLAELAVTGHLRIVQIINRAVPALPEELKNCKKLEQLILAYTKTEVIPKWVSEFSHLEYIHIEGDYTPRRLTTIADGIFDNMPHLSFLHLGGIPSVETLPSLSKLTGLRYLTLAVVSSLKVLPSFEGLSAVTDLIIITAPQATTLPSLAPLMSLTSIGIRPKSAVCCNGYISGTCDLTMDQCLPVASDTFTMTCTDQRISEQDKATLSLYGSPVCANEAVVDREASAPSIYTTDELCGGIKFKSCTLNGVQGICFNTRMMVINCDTTTGFIAMRKLQIERGVGDACDPDVEAWLGCTS